MIRVRTKNALDVNSARDLRVNHANHAESKCTKRLLRSECLNSKYYMQMQSKRAKFEGTCRAVASFLSFISEMPHTSKIERMAFDWIGLYSTSAKTIGAVKNF